MFLAFQVFQSMLCNILFTFHRFSFAMAFCEACFVHVDYCFGFLSVICISERSGSKKRVLCAAA